MLAKSLTIASSQVGQMAMRASASFIPRLARAVSSKTKILTDLQKAQQELGNDSNIFKGQIATVGNQSGGKSELLAAITGLDVFYSVHGMGTRRPNIIDLVSVTGNETYVKFSSWGEPLYDENLIKERLVQANSGDISDEPFHMTVYSPTVRDCSFVDLPGFIELHSEDADIPKVIRDLCRKYINNPDYVKLIVLSAANDFEISSAFKEVYEAGELANSALVMTKLDLFKSDVAALADKLRNDKFMPGLGMFGVRLRSQNDRNNNVTIEELIKNEAAFLEKKGLLSDKYNDLRLGVPHLRDALSEIQLAKIYESLPQISSSIDTYIKKSEENQTLLHKIANLPSLGGISNGMEVLFDRLHPRSPQRRDFEKSMKDKTDEVVDSTFNAAVSSVMKFDYSSVSELRQEILRRGSEIEKTGPTGHLNNLRSVYDMAGTQHSLKGTIPPSLKDEFHALTIYGPCDPTLATGDLDRIGDATLRAKIPTSFFRPCVNSELSGNHEKWLREIGSIIHHSQNNLNLGQKVWDVSVAGLHEFVDIQCQDVLDHQHEGEVVSQFFKYILEQISRQDESERVVDNINKLILCEARPIVNFDEMAYQVSRITNLPFQEVVLPVLGTEKFPFYYPVYGDIWKLAYNEVLKDRVRNNVWRMVGVNVMNPLIRESFRHALEFFQQKNYLNEDRAIEQKVERLRKVQDAIVENYGELEEKYNSIEKFRKEQKEKIEQRKIDQELKREKRDRKKQRQVTLADFGF